MTSGVRRRSVLAGGLAALLAGCGQDSDASSPAALVLDHQYGSTRIPGAPKRVVTMTGSWTDALIALKVPILAEYVTTGYAGPGNRFAWTPEHESQLIEMTTVAEISVEKLAGLQPDLILAGYVGDKATYEKLAAVAPTVPVMDSKAVLDSWQDVTTTAGRIFGHDEQAKQLVADVEKKVTDFKAAHPLDGKTFVFGQLTADGQFGLVADDTDPATKLLASAAGLKLLPAIKTVAKGNTRVLVSSERVDLLAADFVMMWPLSGGPEQFGKLPGWNALPAVRAGATLFLTNDNAAAFGNPTIYSVPYTLDLLQPPLAKLGG
jgi:iron complex transport system substrate-binding protein